jgi:PAS domain S-box-containing protein
MASVAVKGNILIIDDEKSVRMTFQKLLEKEGYTTHGTESINNAIEIIDKRCIDVIFADIVLNQTSGLEILSYLKEQQLAIPVIIITGQPDMNTAAEAVKLGAYDYIIKPLPPFKLLHLARNAVEKKRLNEEWQQIEGLKSDYMHRLEKEVALQTVKIKEGERRYKTLIEQSLIGVFILMDLNLRFVNVKFAELFEYSKEQLEDDFNITKIIRFNNQVTFKEIKEIIRKKSYYFSEVTGVTCNNRELHLELWLSHIIYEEKLATQGIVIDITERKRLQLKQKEMELDLMNQYKLAIIGQLATGVAHNLKNPLSNLLGYTELMHKKHPGIKEIAKIESQIKRMTHIVDTIMRKTHREHAMYTTNVNLNEIVRDEITFLEANLDYKHGVKTTLMLKEDLSDIKAIYSDISQSLQNIILNALDAMYLQNEKRLTITTDEDNIYVYLNVQDTGCGIARENIEHIFDPFFTTKPLHSSGNSSEPVGTGLGLASVKQLLTAYNTQFHIESIVNEGTTFMIKFPK